MSDGKIEQLYFYHSTDSSVTMKQMILTLLTHFEWWMNESSTTMWKWKRFKIHATNRATNFIMDLLIRILMITFSSFKCHQKSEDMFSRNVCQFLGCKSDVMLSVPQSEFPKKRLKSDIGNYERDLYHRIITLYIVTRRSNPP